MLSLSHSQPINDIAVLEYAIKHDIEDIDDLDEFLATDDAEECMLMLGNAGCFY